MPGIYTPEQVKKALLIILDRPSETFKTWPEAFQFLCAFCESCEVSMEMRYHSGWFAKPNLDNPGEIEGEPWFEKDKHGWTIMVGLRSYSNDDGSEHFYGKPTHAVHDGFRLLSAILTERNDNQASSDGKCGG